MESLRLDTVLIDSKLDRKLIKICYQSLVKYYRIPRYRLLARKHDKKLLHFIHIGKAGGSAIKDAFGDNRTYTTDEYIIIFHKHWFKFKDVLPGDKVFFFVRDPVSRFVSAFNSRKRKDLPKLYDEWAKNEEVAFNRFDTANDLAVSLSSYDLEMRQKAVDAMNGIAHVKASYWDWFHSKDYFLSRIDDVLFIGSQENLNRDFLELKEVLGLPEDIELPANEVSMNKSPDGSNKYLSSEAIQNLREWYSRDYDFLNLLKKKKLLRGRT